MERCFGCGFVPIGAGMQNLPKKRRRRIGRYREGGSAVPMLLTVLFSSVGYYAYARQPWKDNFEDVRVHVLGQPPSLHMEGTWEITKLLEPTAPTPGSPARPATGGTLTFAKDGGLTIDLVCGDKPWNATARYEQGEASLKLTHLKSKPANGGPSTLVGALSDLGEGNAMVSFDHGAALFLHRLEGREKVAKTMAYKMAGGMLGRDGSGDDE